MLFRDAWLDDIVFSSLGSMRSHSIVSWFWNQSQRWIWNDHPLLKFEIIACPQSTVLPIAIGKTCYSEILPVSMIICARNQDIAWFLFICKFIISVFRFIFISSCKLFFCWLINYLIERSSRGIEAMNITEMTDSQKSHESENFHRIMIQ